MKKILFYCGLILSTLTFNSCSNDDDDSSPEIDMSKYVGTLNVFSNGIPAGIGGLYTNVNLDDQSRVTSITVDDNTTITFDYVNENTVKMVKKNGAKSTEMEIMLGSNRFATTCHETTNNSGEINAEEWSFRYNDDGQLIYMYRSEGGEKTTIEYKNDDIVSVKTTCNTSRVSSTTIDYVTEEIPELINNTRGLMFFNEMFNIDTDDMQYAYYAGLLGKPTKHLPLALSKIIEEDYINTEDSKPHHKTDKYYHSFGWGFKDKVPTKVYLPSSNNPYSITWE